MKNFTQLSTKLSWAKKALVILCVGGAVLTDAHGAIYVNDNSNIGDVSTTAVGSNANSGTAASPFGSIQFAIDQATAGDTIYVDAGTYTEDLLINKAGLKIMGAGMSLTIVDHSGTPGHVNAGVYINANDVMVNGLTVTGNSAASTPRYGLKVGVGGVPTENVVLQNVRVQNSFRTGFDLARVKNITLTGIEAINNGGAGLFVNNSEGVAISNITTSGNPWGGVSIATRDDWPGTSTGVVFSGINSFAEANTDNGAVQLEMTSAKPISWSNNLANSKDVTIQSAELAYVMSGPTTNTFGVNIYTPYFRFYQTLAQAETAAAGNPTHTDTPRYLRDANSSDGAMSTQFYVFDNDKMTIQAAVDAALQGNTINVGAGDFHEQVEIDKNLTIMGEGKDITNIVAIDNMPLFFTTSNDNYPIIFVHDASNVIIKNLTVDGAGKGNTNYRFVGIGYDDAGGILSNLKVKAVRNTPLNGSQHGIGVMADASSGISRSLQIDSTEVIDFQKNAISLSGEDLQPIIIYCQVEGPGPLGLGLPAQNGIQLWETGLSILVGNTVRNIDYTPDSWTATGFLIYNVTGPVLILGNILEDNEVNIYSYNTNVLSAINEINNGDYGIFAYADQGGSGFALTNTIITGSDYGIYGYAGANGEIYIEAHDNSITNNDSAAIFLEGDSTIVNASCNWYGVTAPEDVAALIHGTDNYIPWLTDGTSDTAGLGMPLPPGLDLDVFIPIEGACNGEPGDDLLIVSDTSWRKSTVTTFATADQYPWQGVNGVPDDATFTLPVEIGQPHAWHSIDSVEGADVIKTGNAITYFRKIFTVDSDTAISAQFRGFMDDGMEIYINGHMLAREDDRSTANAKGLVHNLVFNADGTIENAYMGGDKFDFVNNYRLDSMIVKGENTIVVAIRNASKTGDKGGFSFRMDLKTMVPYTPALSEYIVSDVEWQKSTVTTSFAASSYSAPWTGVASLPAFHTFTEDVEIGQPYENYHSLDVIDGSYPIKVVNPAKNEVTYYMRRFVIVDSADLNVRIRGSFDDNMEVYVNGVKMAREENVELKKNQTSPFHDVKFNEAGATENGYLGGDEYDFVTTADMNSVFNIGDNYIIVAVRNKDGQGGFSLRMDLDKAGVPVIQKRTEAGGGHENSEVLAVDFDLYPNPTSGVVNIDIINEVSGDDNEILVYDMSGRMLFKEDLSSLQMEDGIKVDLSAYPNGLYFVRLRSGDTYVAKRITKQK